MIVVDTNIITYLLIPGDKTYLAEKAFWKDHEWNAPLLWRSEFRNVVLRYIRARIITLEEGFEFMAESQNIMNEREFQVSSHHVLSLAVSSGCTAYDCEYVALADELGISLLTEDRQILAQFPQHAVSLENFVNG